MVKAVLLVGLILEMFMCTSVGIVINTPVERPTNIPAVPTTIRQTSGYNSNNNSNNSSSSSNNVHRKQPLQECHLKQQTASKINKRQTEKNDHVILHSLHHIR